MKIKGVNYDVGRVFQGYRMRPVFDTEIVARELDIIRTDLHANAVAIHAEDIDRARAAAEHALALGLDVWFAPELFDRGQEETLEYTIEAAAVAERLRQRWPQVVLSIGTELIAFMEGILEGQHAVDRLMRQTNWPRLFNGEADAALNAYLARASAAVRRVFHGRITYASLAQFEHVDWSPFDIVGVDLYRDARNRSSYADLARSYANDGKPAVITEFGCCTYRGAGDRGGIGFDIVDWSSMPPKLKGDYVYDQSAQAHELEDQLRALDAAGVEGAFVFEFVQHGPFVHGSQTARDLMASITFDPDIASYALTRFLPTDHGTTYPDMPWEPKESFRAVADYYASH